MARELPTGIEWPRYEDGGLLEIGDIVPVCGKYEELLQVHLGLNAFSLYTETCDEEHMYGQRFKRTVLDADGALIKDGDTVFMTGNWRRGTVVGFEGEFALVEYDARDVNGSTMTVRTAGGCLTHKQPVIDADGVPIKVGDTVYFTDGREQECNTVVNAKYDYKDEPYVQLGRLNEAGYPTYTNCSCIDPSQLTHTKPEPPDTWERIEDDATLEAATYEEEGEDMLKLGTIETFKDAKPTKEQVVKIAEETCEVFSAWETYRSMCEAYESGLIIDDVSREYARVDLLNECADVIQAVSNLVAGLGVTDFTDHIRACEDRNRRRGRL